MDFENLEELKKLRARGVLSEEQFERRYSRMAQRILNDRKEEARSKSGLVYLLLAYFTGTIGLHNFYAGYYKRGGVQLFLTLISFYMYYIPLLVTAFWHWPSFCLSITVPAACGFAAVGRSSGCGVWPAWLFWHFNITRGRIICFPRVCRRLK